MKAEALTPLDLIMPPIYTRVLLVFQASDQSRGTFDRLSKALDIKGQQLAFINGRVHRSADKSNGQHGLEIRFNDRFDESILVDMGSVPDSYKTLREQGFPADRIPDLMRPLPVMVSQDIIETIGTTVLKIGLFRFGEGNATGLSVCVHHQATDAYGVAEILTFSYRFFKRKTTHATRWQNLYICTFPQE